MAIGGGADLATVGLRIDGDSAVTMLDRFERTADRAGRSGDRLEKMARGLRSTLLSMGLALGTGAFFHTLIANTEEAQSAFAQLEAGVRSTGGAAGYSAPQLARMASDLQKVGTYSDEAVAGAESLLLTFTNIRGDVFKEASADVLDLSQRMGGDLNGAAIQVGKALQDPIKGMLALRRVGVSFSESQRQVIKDLVDTGHVVEAQRLILKELETEFGGAAAAARNTLGGSLKGLKNDFGDLFEVSADSSSGVIGAINDLDHLLLFLKDHLDTVQKSVGFGIIFWGAYTTVVKGTAAWTGIVALAHKATAVAVAEEALAYRGATAAIEGYETAAVSANIVTTETVAVDTAAAGAMGTLAVAGEGLIAVLTGPVGIALALTAVIALMLNYKSASDQAAAANARFSSTLGGKTDDELAQEGLRLRAQVAIAQSAVTQMRAAHQDTVLAPMAGLTTKVPQETDAFRQQRLELERLQAQYALIGGEMHRRAGLKPPPMVDVSTGPDRDAIRAREEQNRKMVDAARNAVTLAGMQGEAQERLRIQFEATNKEAEAWADVQTRSVYPATVAAIRAERDLKLQAMDVSTLRAQTQAREDAARSHAQAVVLLGAEGTAQARLRIEYEATNKAIEAQRNFAPGSAGLSGALDEIDTERVQRLMEEQLRVFVTFRNAAKDEMRGLFEDIYNNGLSAFGGLFSRAREMFGKLVADIAARRLMAAIGNSAADSLARLYGGAGRLDPGAQQQRAAVALSGSAGALTSSAAALTTAAARLAVPPPLPAPSAAVAAAPATAAGVPGAERDQYGATALSNAGAALSASATALNAAATHLSALVLPATPVPAAMPGGTYSGPSDWAGDAARAQQYGARAANPRDADIPLQGMVVTVKPRDEETIARESASSFAKLFAKYAAPAMAGFFAGMGVGSSTTSRGVGTIGGAASGALSGFLVGGALGAAIGGLSGAIGGFLGAAKKREEEERMLREVLGKNADRIRELNENITGLSLFAGKNLDKAAAMVRALDSFNGGVINSKDFASALKGGPTVDWLKPYETQFGVTIQDIGRMAQQLGIDLFDSAGRAIPAALKQLEEALKLTAQAATTFTGSMDDVKLRQEAYNKLFDVPDTPLNGLKDAYEQLSQGAPELLKQMGLANLDLSSEAARKVLLSGLQDIFKLVDSGLLTPDLLGAFKDKEGLIQALLGAKAGLDAFKQSLGDVTTDFPKAMDLIIYEQRFGRGVGASTPGTGGTATPPPSPPDTNPGGATTPHRPVNIGTIIVYNNAGDTPRDLTAKLQKAIELDANRGGMFVGETVTPGAGV